MSMSFPILLSYGLMANKAKRWFSTGQRIKWFNRILSGLFASIGGGLLQLRFDR